jgi:hypothetical protein
MAEFTQIHLAGKGYSGRGVRYRVLPPDEIEHIEKVASGTLTKESTVYEFSSAVARMGIEQMVVEVTDPIEPGKQLNGQPWRKLSPEQAHNEWNKLFSTKDTQMLKRLYSREHAVTEEEVDRIMEGKVTVAG